MGRFAVSLCLVAVIASCASEQPRPADLLLLNGRVFTAEQERPAAEAVAIRDGRIVAVGSTAEIEAFGGSNTRRIDLNGHTVVPGINDAHFHFRPDPQGFHVQFETMNPNWQEVSSAVEQAVDQVPADTWIFGTVGSDVVLNEHATRFTLDRLAPDHPVLLRSYYGHGSVVNSKAMLALGIADNEPDPMAGYYERTAGGHRINGRIWEYPERRIDCNLGSQVSDDDAVSELRGLADEALQFGVTSIQVFPSMPIGRFVHLLTEADLPIRVRAIPFPTTSPAGRDLTEVRQMSSLASISDNVTVGGIKWILDGTPFERGAALRRDYADRPGWRGRLNFPEAEIGSMLEESLDSGQPLLVHAVGDRTVEAVLDAMEERSDVDWKQKRVRLEHGDGVLEELIERARKLGVIVVQNPTHFSEPDLFARRWGRQMFPLRSLVEAGIPVALGSDGPLNPYLNIMLASVHPYRPSEALGREQAVRAYTQGSAFAEFAEADKGTIAPGKLADMAVLSQDIFSAPAPSLPGTRSVLTIVGGKIAHDANVLR